MLLYRYRLCFFKINYLSIRTYKRFSNFIGEMLTLDLANRDLNKEFRDSRFSKGQCCHHCKSTSVVNNGKLK